MSKVKKLYPHQEKALELTKGKNRVAYYLDMGLGKTLVGIEKMLELGAKNNLIVCQKSMIKMWIEEVTNQIDGREECIIYDLTKPKQYELFIHQSKHIESGVKLIGVINYDIVYRRKELFELERFTLILDESSMIQNDNTKRTKAIQRMDAGRVILLSGTPVAGAYEKLYSQVKLLGWNISKTKFWDEFVKWVELPIGQIHIKKVTGYKNIPKLKSKLSELGCIFMKTDEVFELPQQVITDIKVKNIPAYKTMLKDSLVTINGDELLGNTPITKMLRLRQLCGIYNEAKTKALLDLLNSTEDRVIIFYNFTSELNHILNVIKPLDRPISIVNGESKDTTQFEYCRNGIALIQYQAGSRGLNLQMCNKIIYYTLPLSTELYEQSKKRTHRIGQSQTCFYYNLLVENSIELEILERLKEKKDYTDSLFIQRYIKE